MEALRWAPDETVHLTTVVKTSLSRTMCRTHKTNNNTTHTQHNVSTQRSRSRLYQYLGRVLSSRIDYRCSSIWERSTMKSFRAGWGLRGEVISRLQEGVSQKHYPKGWKGVRLSKGNSGETFNDEHSSSKLGTRCPRTWLQMSKLGWNCNYTRDRCQCAI